MGNTVSMKRKIFLVFLVTFSSIVLLIPYLAYDFYNQFLTAYGVTDTQMGLLLTAYAASAVPSYFFGGWIADIFNPKKAGHCILCPDGTCLLCRSCLFVFRDARTAFLLFRHYGHHAQLERISENRKNAGGR